MYISIFLFHKCLTCFILPFLRTKKTNFLMKDKIILYALGRLRLSVSIYFLCPCRHHQSVFFWTWNFWAEVIPVFLKDLRDPGTSVSSISVDPLKVLFCLTSERPNVDKTNENQQLESEH